MCLKLKGKQDKPTERVTVYKFYFLLSYTGDNDAINKGKGVIVESPYRHTRTWIRSGRCVKSNRQNRALTKGEQVDGRVQKGIHAYMSPAKARKAAEANYSRIYGAHTPIVVRLSGLPQDFVGRGTFSDSKSIVFKKLRVEGIVQKGLWWLTKEQRRLRRNKNH